MKTEGRWKLEIRLGLQSGHPFPLTPTLSLGERENRTQPLGKSKSEGCWTVIPKKESLRLLFPLPEGEGQGVGEQRAQFGEAEFSDLTLPGPVLPDFGFRILTRLCLF